MQAGVENHITKTLDIVSTRIDDRAALAGPNSLTKLALCHLAGSSFINLLVHLVRPAWSHTSFAMLSPMPNTTPGQVGWLDITVPEADGLRDFYSAVVGWKADALSMGDYNDYTMTPANGADPVAGICHARGSNASLPPVWLPYFLVADAQQALDAAVSRGAEVLKPLPQSGRYKFAVLRDPAGAPFALFEASSK